MFTEKQIKFPRKPYDGQLKLAQSIYSACKNGSTAIFESPTGTGKSLAVLSGALSYLNEHSFDKQKVLMRIEKLKKEYKDVSIDKTIENAEKFKKMHVLRCELDELDEKLHVQAKIEKHLTDLPEEALRKERQQYTNDNDENTIDDKEPDDIVELGKKVKKLIYVSRTHSQLTQFIREMDNPLNRSMRPVQIGSRASVCLNPSVNSLPSALVNCECSRLVKNSSGDIEDIDFGSNETAITSSKRSKRETCPFYKRSKILELRSRIWKGALIDSSTTLKEEGEKLGACPFFAAKAALPLCDVVAMPYNVLFDKVSRDSYGVDIENVVIVDEAHNFLSTVYETASFTLNIPDLNLAKNALEFYMENTRSTKPDKLLAVRQMISTLDRFTSVLQSKAENSDIQLLKPIDIQRDMATTADYLKLATLIDSGGILRESRGILSRYWTSIQKSNDESTSTNKLSALAALVRKSNANSTETINAKTNRGMKRIATPMPEKSAKIMKMSEPKTVIKPVERLQIDGVQLFGSLIKLFRAFLQSDSAKFVYQPKEQQVRYIRLDIDSDLQKVIKNSKAFLMIGGSMRPQGYISSVLRSSCSINNVIEQQFGHVIPERNLLPLVVSADAQNNPLSLKVSQLNDTILSRYARTLIELFNHIPYGCVVFLPNYNLINVFEKLLSALKPRKQLFSEKRGQDVNDLMRKFSQSANNSRSGAVLLASASGRLGEGINFADNMCRGVIMIGLPYPNAMDVETKLRATHAVEQGYCSGVHDYLSQACTRVVSQCMGRAIRHANDFSALIFMDLRYERSSGSRDFVSNLPSWMTKDLKTIHFVEFPTIFSKFYNTLMAEFYNQKRLK